MSRHLIFVYGTLKTGEPNHYLITDKSNGLSEFVSKAETVDEWPLVIASKYNIPYLLYKKDFGKIISGELYSVDDLMLSKMDELESHPTYYTRLETPVKLEDGSIQKPWIYFIMDFKPELLNLVTYSNYSSDGDHGLRYLEKTERNQTIEELVENYDVLSDIKLFL